MNLDDQSREILFREYGILVASRTDAIYQYDLYHLFAFYVETQYLLPSDKLIRYCTFEKTDQLDAYLPELNIACLFSD